MKKIICLFILLMSLGSLTACTGGGAGIPTIDSQPQSSTTPGTDEPAGTVKTGATTGAQESSAAVTTTGSNPEGNTTSAETAVAQLVMDFGKRLQMFSLLAPKEQVKKSIQEQYAEFVTPTLLAKWLKDPQSAPGRTVSSPWPDRIDVIFVENVTEEAYTVKGEIVEITSTEKENGGFAAKRPITLQVIKSGGKWLIDDVTMGEYEKPGPIVYTNTKYGFSASLPQSWKGFTVVESQWEGLSLGNGQGENVIETGPILSIRHPGWTKAKPRQDIPIMVFTLAQWESMKNDQFHIGAAPVLPTSLLRTDKYVFALPARYNFAFPEGYEEVEDIIMGNPLTTLTPK